MLDFSQFLDQLASPEPVPGGGSAAALETAVAAGLLAMVANLTIGKKRYLDVQEEVEAIRARALDLMRTAERLVQEDVDAYGRVHEAMGLPKETDAQREERTGRIQEALKGAALPPLETMRVACELVELAGPLSQIGNRSAISDVGTAALSAQAGFYGARLNVLINLASVRDVDWVAETRKRMEGLGRPDQAARKILDRVEDVIAGNGS